ncbi:hypothetical protein BB934_03845 [Microvirga ossetica]|uniref:Uncharacterized protein n=1 Tax=Microvirga ossetica TaxID=1882682 RepID=A0A1B2EBX3_9HYPH|nr:hypothetical protein BB934_03845 [Microvirga ossetica]
MAEQYEKAARMLGLLGEALGGMGYQEPELQVLPLLMGRVKLRRAIKRCAAADRSKCNLPPLRSRLWPDTLPRLGQRPIRLQVDFNCHRSLLEISRRDEAAMDLA